MANISNIILSVAVFFAVVLYLTINQNNREKWVGIAFSIASLGGLIVYGYAYSQSPDASIVEVLRTVIDTGRMFAGMNNVALFTEAVGQGSPWLIFFWIIHFMAYYSMASVFVLVLGKSAIRKFRTWLLRINDVELIYGINESSIAYGRTVSRKKKVSVVFVDTDGMKWESDIREMGGLIYNDPSALHPDKKFIKKLGLRKGKGKLYVAALSENSDSNYDYAKELLNSLKECKVEPSQLGITMIGREELDGIKLLAHKEEYGYGSVKVFDRTELIARLLMQKYPLCNCVSFDDKGCAKEDMQIVLIGFGRLGQEILKKLVANGQFQNSKFSLKVYDPKYQEIDGFFRLRYGSLLENYDIEFLPYDGRSRQATEYIKGNIKKIKYIVTAVGDDVLGREIATNIQELICNRDNTLPIYQCTKDSVICYRYGEEREIWSLDNADILYGGKMDDLAKLINHYYHGEEGTPDSQWAQCDYFSRMSCRASADFLSSLFTRLGIDKNSTVSEEYLENLARTEHLRWIAFHLSMGFSRMSKEVLNERVERFKKDPSIRIAKDLSEKLHACLIPWDELDELSRFENGVTGKDVDYKQMDRDNILVMLKLLGK
jgi:hypothetical protein